MRHKATKNGIQFTFTDMDLKNMSKADNEKFVFEDVAKVPDFVERAMVTKIDFSAWATGKGILGLAGTSPSARLDIKGTSIGVGGIDTTANTTQSPAPAKVRKNKKNGIHN